MTGFVEAREIEGKWWVCRLGKPVNPEPMEEADARELAAWINGKEQAQ